MKGLDVSPEQLKAVVPGLEVASEVFRGAQKIVYHCLVAGESCALKVLIPPQGARSDFDVEIARARREVEIMAQCNSRYVVKQGPLPLTRTKVAGRDLVYFTEMWVEGTDLQTVLATEGVLSVAQAARLGLHMTRAVEALWRLTKIHRDIKPENIMRRGSSGEFILTDMGAALDLQDVSLSSPGFLPGTEMYFSPEQLHYTNKRQLDFRSDLFSLGIVLYEALTGINPFYSEGMRLPQLLHNIAGLTPPPPSRHRPDIPELFDRLVMRLLEKDRERRYLACSDLCADLEGLR